MDRKRTHQACWMCRQYRPVEELGQAYLPFLTKPNDWRTKRVICVDCYLAVYERAREDHLDWREPLHGY